MYESKVRTVTATLKSISPYSQSRHYVNPPKGAKETSRDYEARTWMYRTHANFNDDGTGKDDGKGNLFIPPMAFKNCLSEVAKFLSVQIPGKGKSTYTKHFEAGIMVLEGITLPLTRTTVKGEWLFVPADGVRGSGKRVEKCFPIIHEWAGKVNYIVVDETITMDVFERHLCEAGNFIGIGRFRPRNNGMYGRFKVLDLKWSGG